MKVACRYQPVADAESRRRGDRLVHWLRGYAEHRLGSRLMDERRSVPAYVGLDLADRGVFGMQMEERFGGLALRTRDLARVLEQAAGVDLSFGTWILVCLFPGVRPLATFATGGLRDELLPRLASGRVLAGYAQTEPGAGTHFPAMAATALAQPGGGWRVSGDKWWIGNSSWAGVLTVMAQEVDASGRRKGLTALAVPTDAPGVRLGRELASMGMRAMVQGEVGFRDVAVGPERLLGEAGRGLEVGVDSMCWSRFAIASTCLGAMRRCAQLTLRFGQRRTIATGRLAAHPVFAGALGETLVQVALTEALLYRVAEILDEGRGVSVDLFSVCKIVASEFLWSAADRLVQALGARGYDEANGVPQLLRDARVTRIFEGTSEALLAYVGSQALAAHSELHAFLREDLGAPDASDALRKALAGASGSGAAGRAWLCARAGWLATWTLLAAAAEQRAAAAPAAGLERAVDWARMRFDEARVATRAGALDERFVVEASRAEEIVSGYTAAIGDVEQTLPGLREELDPLLRREPPPDGA